MTKSAGLPLLYFGYCMLLYIMSLEFDLYTISLFLVLLVFLLFWISSGLISLVIIIIYMYIACIIILPCYQQMNLHFACCLQLLEIEARPMVPCSSLLVCLHCGEGDHSQNEPQHEQKHGKSYSMICGKLTSCHSLYCEAMAETNLKLHVSHKRPVKFLHHRWSAKCCQAEAAKVENFQQWYVHSTHSKPKCWGCWKNMSHFTSFSTYSCWYEAVDIKLTSSVWSCCERSSSFIVYIIWKVGKPGNRTNETYTML